MTVLDGTFLQSLSELHSVVKETLSSPNQGRHSADKNIPSLNAKGDVQQPFDLVVHEIVRNWLADRFESGAILSEEDSAVIRFGKQPPAYRFVVDPVDGSDNYERGLALSAVSVAVVRGEEPIGLDEVLFSMVGGLEAPEPFLAARGEGAWHGTRPLYTSSVERLADAFVSCELNHWAPNDALAGLLKRSKGVRSYGCASRAIALVAQGSLDAHIDVRERLTPESFLAAVLLLKEAGGHVCKADGTPLGSFPSLLTRTTLVAASTPELAKEIVSVLAEATDAPRI